MFARVTYYVAFAAAIHLAGGWRVLGVYWVLPLFSWFLVLMRLRGIAEHWGINGRVGTRTTLVSWIEGFLLAPHNIGYHADHHLFPAVRFYALPELHRVLAGRGVFENKSSRRTKGFWGVFRECARPR